MNRMDQFDSSTWICSISVCLYPLFGKRGKKIKGWELEGVTIVEAKIS